VRVYQPEESIDVGCDPGTFPTAQWIDDHERDYRSHPHPNPNPDAHPNPNPNPNPNPYPNPDPNPDPNPYPNLTLTLILTLTLTLTRPHGMEKPIKSVVPGGASCSNDWDCAYPRGSCHNMVKGDPGVCHCTDGWVGPKCMSQAGTVAVSSG